MVFTIDDYMTFVDHCELIGYKCLSPSKDCRYEHSQMMITCLHGHTSMTTYHELITKNILCQECLKQRKFLRFVNKANDNGVYCLSDRESFEHDDSSLMMLCEEGHMEFRTYNNFMIFPKCNDCNAHLMDKHKKRALEIVKDPEFRYSYALVCISDKDTIKYICRQDKTETELKLVNFTKRSLNRLCNHCNTGKRRRIQK